MSSVSVVLAGWNELNFCDEGWLEQVLFLWWRPDGMSSFLWWSHCGMSSVSVVLWRPGGMNSVTVVEAWWNELCFCGGGRME
jgi:hypothetical protein